MRALKENVGLLDAVFRVGFRALLLWMACTIAQAGGVVVDATRSFTVGKTLSDLQDPPLTVSATITNSPIKILTDVKVGLHLVGEPAGRGFASEIYVSLNKDLQVSSILLNQVGVRDGDPVGFGYDGWQVTFADSAASDVHLEDIGSGVMTGEIQPDGRLKPEDVLRPAMLSVLSGGVANGQWHLSVADLDFGGTMSLESWSLTLAGLTNRPPVFMGLTNAVIPEMAVYQQTLRAEDPDLASQALIYWLVSGPEGAEVVDGVFRWAPTEVQGPSTNVIRVAVTDGSDASTHAFTVIVAEVNRAPALGGAPEVTIPEGTLHTLPLSGGDPDVPVQTLSLRMVEGPDGSELVDGVFRWTPSEDQGPSIQRFRVEVSDGVETVTNSFLIHVSEANQAPVMNQPVSEDVDELSTYEQRFFATDDDVPVQEVSFRLVSGPEGAVVSDGILSWTPSEAMGPSVQTILVAADDGLGSVTNSFTLRVNEVNRAPVFSGLLGANIPKLTPYSQRLVAIDADLPAQTLTCWLVSGPAGSSVVGDLFTWTPGVTQGDQTHRVVVAVSDGALSVTNSFSLQVGGENSAPRFLGLTDEEAPELAEFSRVLSVADSDVPTQTLTVSLVEGPAGSEVIGGRFVWFPTESQGPSTNRIVVAVSDGFTRVTSEFVMTITEVNRLPVWGAMTDAVIDVNEPYSQTLSASDSDLPVQPLAYRLVSGPSGARVDAGVLRWTPGPEHALSIQKVTVAVDDGYGSVTNSLELTVKELKPVNGAPIAGASWVMTDEDTPVDLTLQGVDLEGSPLTYTVVRQPGHGTLIGEGAVRRYVPNADFNGTDSFIFRVNDGELDSGLAKVTVWVKAVNDAPNARALSVATDEDVPVDVTLQGVDSEGSPLTYTVVRQPGHGTLIGEGAVRRYVPNADFNGADSLTFRVNDGDLDSGLATVSIQVKAVNDVPVAGARSFPVIQGASVAITLSGYDADQDRLGYQVVSQPRSGTLSGSGANWIYRANDDAVGTDSFAFRVNDGIADSGVASVRLIIGEKPALGIRSSDGSSIVLEVRAQFGSVVQVESASTIGAWTPTAIKVTGRGRDFSVPVTIPIDRMVPARFWRLKVLSTP